MRRQRWRYYDSMEDSDRPPAAAALQPLPHNHHQHHHHHHGHDRAYTDGRHLHPHNRHLLVPTRQHDQPLPFSSSSSSSPFLPSEEEEEEQEGGSYDDMRSNSSRSSSSAWWEEGPGGSNHPDESGGAGAPSTVIHTNLPSRLDRLPFSAYHWLLVVSLGITWMLDGLEVTVVSVLSAHLKRDDTLGLTDVQVGLSVSLSILGAILGSLVFGYLCDRYGRKRLYLTTPLVYAVATGLSAFAWDFYSFALLRFVTGAGLGGEYSAMNSAIDELIPARVRGRVDLAVNGSYWFGAAVAAAMSLAILNPHFLGSADFGWRALFGVGAALGLVIVGLRLALPESPRWLMTRGRMEEADRVVSEIERRAHSWNAALRARLPAFLVTRLIGPGHKPPPRRVRAFGVFGDVSSSEYYEAITDEEDEEDDEEHDVEDRSGGEVIAIEPREGATPLGEVARALFVQHRMRTLLGLVLMVAQAFFYNAIFFAYPIVLVEFYGVSSERVGLYLVPFALGNFLGPLVLGSLFDTIGRRKMIALTYSLSAVLLVITGWLFASGLITALAQAALWSAVFFVASPAASAAYLTVSEIFPLEIRALAISFFYSVGTGMGGVVAPVLFGWLLETRRAENIFYGYLAAAALMLAAALVETAIGVDAEKKSLERITTPLSVVSASASATASIDASAASSLASSTSSSIFFSPSPSFSTLPAIHIHKNDRRTKNDRNALWARTGGRPPTWRELADPASLRAFALRNNAASAASSPRADGSGLSPRAARSAAAEAGRLSPNFLRSLSTPPPSRSTPPPPMSLSSSSACSVVPSPARGSPSVPPALERDERDLLDAVDLVVVSGDNDAIVDVHADEDRGQEEVPEVALNSINEQQQQDERRQQLLPTSPNNKHEEAEAEEAGGPKADVRPPVTAGTAQHG